MTPMLDDTEYPINQQISNDVNGICCHFKAVFLVSSPCEKPFGTINWKQAISYIRRWMI